MRDDLNPDPEENSDNVASSRREFLIGLGRWSPAVIGGIFLGSRTREAAAWYNSGAWNNHAVEGSWAERYRGGGGWFNRGGAWVNGGPGGGGWFNRGGGWFNRGGAWINHNWANRYSGGGGWFNRGGAWANRGRAWANNAGRNWANRRPGGGSWYNHGRAWVNR